MKVLTYNRSQPSYHVHNSFNSEIIYLPNLKVLFYKETSGTFSSVKYGLCENETILLEAKSIYGNNGLYNSNMNVEETDGRLISFGELTINNVKIIELDNEHNKFYEYLIINLIKSCKDYVNLKNIMKRDIDYLFEISDNKHTI